MVNCLKNTKPKKGEIKERGKILDYIMFTLKENPLHLQ